MGFLSIGLMGFGGVAAIARHVIVERRRWLSEQDYANILGVGQVLPGGNLINMTVMLGDRFQGAAGSCIALLGLMLMPLIILLAITTVYDHYAHLEDVRSATMGAAAAASGLVIGTAIKMGRALKLSWPKIGVVLVAFLALAVARFPLVLILLTMIPISLGVVWWERRR